MNPRLAVHKFSSCDGCQLSLLNLGEDLPRVADRLDIVHFAEAGPMDEDAQVDIALVEGSISTPEEIERIAKIRANSGLLVAIGACAVSGGLQALRNLADDESWKAAIYAHPEYINTLETATPVAEHTRVDVEIWGCPVSGQQVTRALRDLLSGVAPQTQHEKVCGTCKFYRLFSPLYEPNGWARYHSSVSRTASAYLLIFPMGCFVAHNNLS